MDYLNLTDNERETINELLAKDESELTTEELKEVVAYRATWNTYRKYQKEILEEREKAFDIAHAYNHQLSEESKAKFEERVKSILGEDYVMGE